MIRVKQATIALTRGDATGALAIALQADALATRLQNQRLRATTLRILADSRARLGERNSALELVHEAAEIAASHGTWLSQAKCFRLAANLTGNVDFARRAQELQIAHGSAQ